MDQNSVYTLANNTAYPTDKSSGGLLWTMPLTYPPDVDARLLGGIWVGLAGGHVIVADIDLFGLDPATGSVAWRFAPRATFPGERTFQLLATDGTTVFCGGVRGNLYAVDAASGTQRWATHVVASSDTAVRVFNPVLANGEIYAAFVNDHGAPATNVTSTVGVAAVDASSGMLRWSVNLPVPSGQQLRSESQGLAVIGSHVIAAGGNGNVYSLDAATGSVTDSVPRTVFGIVDSTAAGTWFKFAAADTVVVIGTVGGAEVALDARNIHQRLWNPSHSFGGVSDVAVIDGRVYTTFFGGQLVVADAATGQAIWWLQPYDLQPSGESTLYAPAVDSTRIYVGTDHNVYAFQKK